MGVCERRSNLARRLKPLRQNAICVCLDIRKVGLAKREAYGKYLSWRHRFRSLVHMWVMGAKGIVKTVQRKVYLAVTGLLTISLSSKLPRNSELPKHLQVHNTYQAHLLWLHISSAWSYVCCWVVMSLMTRETKHWEQGEARICVGLTVNPLKVWLFGVSHFSHKKTGSKRMSIPQVLCIFMLYYNHPVAFLSPLLISKSYTKEGLHLSWMSSYLHV